MISDPFNVKGLGEILNITFERGSFVSKLIILIVSVPEFCEYFSSANNEDVEKVKKNNKATVEVIKTKNSFNIVYFISIKIFRLWFIYLFVLTCSWL
jgi:hypothetical protein